MRGEQPTTLTPPLPSPIVFNRLRYMYTVLALTIKIKLKDNNNNNNIPLRNGVQQQQQQ